MIQTKEACEILDVTPSGISRMVKRGNITPAKIVKAGHRGVFLFDRADVEYLAAHRPRTGRPRQDKAT